MIAYSGDNIFGLHPVPPGLKGASEAENSAQEVNVEQGNKGYNAKFFDF